MEVRLGDEVARCTECGGSDFVHIEPGTDLTYLSDLLCATCEVPTSHGALILQIGESALRAARGVLRPLSRSARLHTFPLASVRRDSRFALRTAKVFRIFQGVSEHKVLGVMQHCRASKIGKQMTWVARGKRLPGLVYVETGLLRLVLRGAGGAETLFQLVRPGEVFGLEASLLPGGCRYDVIAAANSTMLILPAAQISRLFERNLSFARNVAKALAKRLDDLLTEFESSTLSSALQRLAAYLMGVAKPGPARGRSSARLPVSKSILAARLGIRTETLSRLWRALTLGGLIEISKDQIAILNPERLARIAKGIDTRVARRKR